MIKLIGYQHCSIDFLNKVVGSKRLRQNELPPFYKHRIIDLIPMVSPAYQVYDIAFLQNQLHTVTASVSFTPDQKADALQLYDYSTKPFTILKNAIITLPNNYEVYTCQYCTIGSINTLDHIMPKDDYPEFVVHPKNLIPVCSQCNSYKSEKWITNGIHEFLNPYLNILPRDQFLFANINYVNDTFEVNFELRNPNFAIPIYLFNVIQNHYRNLHLLERFKNQSSKIISEFENSIKGSLTNQSLDQAIDCARATARFNQGILGFNHFENIIKLELCNGVAFRQYCQVMGY